MPLNNYPNNSSNTIRLTGLSVASTTSNGGSNLELLRDVSISKPAPYHHFDSANIQKSTPSLILIPDKCSTELVSISSTSKSEIPLLFSTQDVASKNPPIRRYNSNICKKLKPTPCLVKKTGLKLKSFDGNSSSSIGVLTSRVSDDGSANLNRKNCGNANLINRSKPFKADVPFHNTFSHSFILDKTKSNDSFSTRIKVKFSRFSMDRHVSKYNSLNHPPLNLQRFAPIAPAPSLNTDKSLEKAKGFKS